MRSDTVASEVFSFLLENPGKTDGEINQMLFEGEKNHSHINITCRTLVDRGLVVRLPRFDQKLGNFPTGASIEMPSQAHVPVLRTDIRGGIERFLLDSKKPNHRYKSWDYCFRFFERREEIRESEELQDYAALHLAWFLASWGMLRGSADLLWKNHTFLVPVVNALISSRFDNLVGFGPLTGDTDLLVEGLFGRHGLTQSIRRSFLALDRTFSASDILVTKVLLGTTACSMAYDQYVSAGLKRCGLTAKFGERSTRGVSEFYRKHASQFEGIDGHDYPPFKLLDMYFFDLGMAK